MKSLKLLLFLLVQGTISNGMEPDQNSVKRPSSPPIPIPVQRKTNPMPIPTTGSLTPNSSTDFDSKFIRVSPTNDPFWTGYILYQYHSPSKSPTSGISLR